MYHSPAWKDFLPAAHCGSHGHVLPTAPSSSSHLSHPPHFHAFDTLATTSSCQTYKHWAGYEYFIITANVEPCM